MNASGTQSVTPDSSISSAHTRPSLGVVLFGATLGVEVMLILLLQPCQGLGGTRLRQFTNHVRDGVQPERDLPIYAAGICLSLLLIAVLVWASRWLQYGKSHQSTDRRFQNACRTGLAILGFGASLLLLRWLAPMHADGQRIVPGVARLLLLTMPTICLLGLATTGAVEWVVARLSPALPWIGAGIIAASITFQIHVFLAALPLLAVMIGASWRSDWHARRRGETIPWRSLLANYCLFALLSVFIYLQLDTTAGSTADRRLWLPALAVAVAFLIDLVRSARGTATAGDYRLLRHSVDVLFSLFLFSIIFIPHRFWPAVAGSMFQRDELHHWNFFAFGPALAFSHGSAMASGVYSQYGCALPMLLAWGQSIVPLTYANTIGMSIAGGSGYFVLLYIFLRMLLKSAGWAATGAILAVTLQLFCGIGGDELIWNYPSSTMLRHPIDVLCFIALLLHQRRQRVGWFYLAAALVGLAVLFELDTGIHLAIVFGFYWLVLHVRSLRNNWRPPLVAYTIAVTTWMTGLLIGAHGHIFFKDFWNGYFEGMRIQAFMGLGLLPFGILPLPALGTFAAIVILYITCIGWGVWSHAAGERSTAKLFLSVLAAYGLGIMLLFVGRTHPLNLFHVMVPLAIVIAISGELVFGCGGSTSAIGWCAAICFCGLLVTKPEFLRYPNLLRSRSTPAPPLLAMSYHPPDLAAFPQEYAVFVRSIALISKAVRQLPADDRQVLILDEHDTLIDYLSGRAPWSRYTSLFHGMLTWDQVRGVQLQILEQKPRYVIMRNRPTKDSAFADQWEVFRRLITRHYRLDHDAGDFEIWRYRK